MSVGPILPPPAGGGRAPAPVSPPAFQALTARPARSPLSGREALLASVLLHALLALALLTVPSGLFHPGAGTPLVFGMTSRGEDDRIPMAFVQDAPRAAEPNPEARAASDRDRRRGQEEQPNDPAMAGPFSRGNTPALIAEGPLGAPVGPPGAPGEDEPRAPPPGPGGDPPEGADRGAAEGRPGLDAGETRGRLLFAPPRDGGGARGADVASRDDRGARLREALSQMGASGSVGGGGGVPYKFDNPTAGLATPTGTLSFDTKGFDWGPYARRIYWIIWSNWHARMPPAINTGLKGAVTVHFVIQKDGTLTGIRILSGSGVPAYDSAAVLALEASSPLPPLPESFPRDSEGVTGRFLYNMSR